MGERPAPVVLWLTAAGAGLGCAAPFAEDGSSVSVGTTADGALRHGAVLPDDGDSWTIPKLWRERKSHCATDEAVDFVARVARRFTRRSPGSRVLIGDLSRRGGGASPEHRSHGSGRDVDFFFLAVAPDGKAVTPGDAMIHFAPDGRAMRWSAPNGHAAPRTPLPALRFDVGRNWRLVEAMLTDPDVEIEWVFIERSLAAMLLEHAAAVGADPALISRAAFILHQPADSQPHDDHMHVRLYCDVHDRALGCADRGPQRWWKKRWKWMSAARPNPIEVDEIAQAVVRLIRSESPRIAGAPVLASGAGVGWSTTRLGEL